MIVSNLLKGTLRVNQTVHKSLHTSTLLAGSKKKAVGEYLYGLYPCLGAISNGRRVVHKIFIREEKEIQEGEEGTEKDKQQGIKSFRRYELYKYAETNNIPLINVSASEIDNISGNRPHQGVAMDVTPLLVKDLGLKEIEDEANNSKVSPPVWLFLEAIRDPMNLGAILRSSKYFGIDRVILSSHCSRLSPVVSKASAGAMETMDIRAITNTTKFLWHIGMHWKIIGTCSPMEEENLYQTVQVHDLEEMKIEKPTLILFGNEGEGLSEKIAEFCHSMVTIKPWGELPEGLDSLNVSVSAGILLHKVSRVRPSNEDMAQRNL